MLKQNKGKVLLGLALMLLPMVLGLLLWGRLPEQVPTHWNFAGEVDGYSSRTMAVFGLPGFLLVLYVLCLAFTAADPKAENIRGRMLNVVLFAVPLVSLVMTTGMYLAGLGMAVDMEVISTGVVGLLFIVLGNWLPKCQPSYTVGIKLPWTIHDESNWRRTHRFAGPLWMAGGLVILLSPLLGEAGAFVLLAVILVLAVVPTVYSYLLFRRSRGD